MSQPTSRAVRAPAVVVERTQTGVRIEKRLLKVLKALADYHDLSLGDLLEGIVLHAFEGKAPSFFSDPKYLLIGPMWFMKKIRGQAAQKA